MDLSGEVTAALRLLGDASKIELAKYQEVLQKVTEDIAKDTPANSSAPHPAGKEDGEVSRCHAALATLFLETVRDNHNVTVISSVLEDLSWPSERIIDATKAVESHRTAIQSKLASLGTFPPHVVDIDWKLSYQVRSSDGEEGGGAMYLVTLHTEESRGKRGKITFSCSLAQLTHLVTRLRQASRCVQKYASNS
ncbi:COMM domain-containing protein 3-like [Portunus trituberculatus]|uniref:COMM domain-containing protein 3-like n=1 Tax=Portunus trituberculatus TaxID=210409 RepID=UPI001E1CF272|nr:COMM domain-containing protein 3-like [Portunus trituberculatus]